MNKYGTERDLSGEMNDGCDTIGAENEIDILRCRILFSIDLVLFLNEEFTVTAATL